jgi:hypothetical protein
MEKSNPFLAYERGCSPEELLFAWKKLLIDQDVMSNFADQMADPAATNVMAAWCTNKSDPDLIRLKEAVALKNAPRTSWKMLCLSSHGGGPEKFRGFLSDKVDDSDKTVACIARRCLAFYSILERQFTSLRSSKKTSASKIEGQRQELMLLVYHGIKHMKLSARKSAARNSSDLALMNLVFAPDIAVGLAKCVFESSSSVSNFDEPPHKRGRRDSGPDCWIVDTAGSSPRSSSHRGSNVTAQSTLDSLLAMAKSQSSKAVHQHIDVLSRSQDPAVVKAVEQVKNKYCRNCLTSNRGAVGHSTKECREMGNKPGGPCNKCKRAGKPDAFHWAADCKLFG